MAEAGNATANERPAAANVGSSGGTVAPEAPKKSSSFKKAGQMFKKVFSPRKTAAKPTDKVADPDAAVSNVAPPVAKPAEEPVVVEEPSKEEPPAKKTTRAPLFSAIGIAAAMAFIAFKVATK